MIDLFDGCGYRQDSRTRGGKECGWLVVEDRRRVKISAELRSCVKVELAVLGSPSLIVLSVSVAVKQH